MARAAFVICGDADMTIDVVQSAWAIAWQRIGSLRDPSLIRAWLVAVAANEARQAMQRRRRRTRVVDVSDELAERSAGVDWNEPARPSSSRRPSRRDGSANYGRVRSS